MGCTASLASRIALASNHFSSFLGMVNTGLGVAAIVGSVSAWWALCQIRMIDGTPLQGEQPELELSFAVWLWACSLLTAVGVICISAVKASDQQAVAPPRNDAKV